MAATIKEWIDSTFLGKCEVFVSSDSDSLPAGSRWLDRISSALDQANVMVVLCSSASIERPWVNFETGCAWAKGIPVIPVCHTGITRGALPRPLAEFQGLDADDSTFPTQLISSLARYLGISKLPRLDSSAMIQEVEKAIATASVANEKAASSRANLTSGLPPQPAALASESVTILKFLSGQRDRFTTAQLAQVIGSNLQRTEYFIDQLNDAKLLSKILVIGQGALYQLSKEGRHFIFGSGAA